MDGDLRSRAQAVNEPYVPLNTTPGTGRVKLLPVCYPVASAGPKHSLLPGCGENRDAVPEPHILKPEL